MELDPLEYRWVVELDRVGHGVVGAIARHGLGRHGDAARGGTRAYRPADVIQELGLGRRAAEDVGEHIGRVGKHARRHGDGAAPAQRDGDRESGGNARPTVRVASGTARGHGQDLGGGFGLRALLGLSQSLDHAGLCLIGEAQAVHRGGVAIKRGSHRSLPSGRL